MLENTSNQFFADLNRCAENNATFCTKDINYPLEHIQNVLREHANKYAGFFTTDMSETDNTDRVVNRIENFDDEYLCESSEKVIYPTAGKTQNGIGQYIINTKEFQQGVRVSLCRKAGQPCKMSEHFPFGYKTECKQQMVYRQLVSLSSNGAPITDHFEFPACCSCVIHRG